MKKFFTVLPLQEPSSFIYKSEENINLQLDEEVPFPILTAISGYAESEEIRVIALVSNIEPALKNVEVFNGWLDKICKKKNLSCKKGLETLIIENNDSVSTHVQTFLTLIDYVDDNDILFGCMTYGTKPTSTAMMMAIQYAYRVKSNASIECIVYGQINRPNPKDKTTWSAEVYDMTALVQVDEILHVLAQANVTDPKDALNNLLSR